MLPHPSRVTKPPPTGNAAATGRGTHSGHQSGFPDGNGEPQRGSTRGDRTGHNPEPWAKQGSNLRLPRCKRGALPLSYSPL